MWAGHNLFIPTFPASLHPSCEPYCFLHVYLRVEWGLELIICFPHCLVPKAVINFQVWCFIDISTLSQTVWCTFIVSAHRRLRQKGCRFKVSLNCIVSPHLKTNKNTSIICHCYLRPCFLKSSTGPYLKVPQSGMYISVVEGLPSIQKALDLIYSSTPNSFFLFSLSLFLFFLFE